MCSRLLYLLTDFHFQLNWSFRKVTFIILKSMSLFAQQFIIFEKHTRTNKQTVSSVPLAFQVSDRLDQSGYHLPIPTPIYWHGCRCQIFQQFTNRVTDMVNLSEHLCSSQPKHAEEMTALKPNVCPRVNSSGCTHN